MRECGNRCYEIGGPWISFDPECPVHGYEARREAEDRADEMAALKNRIAALEAALATPRPNTKDET